MEERVDQNKSHRWSYSTRSRPKLADCCGHSCHCIDIKDDRRDNNIDLGFIIPGYEEQLDKMAVELKLVQSELEAKNQILEENDAALRLMLKELDKMKETEEESINEREHLKEELKSARDCASGLELELREKNSFEKQMMGNYEVTLGEFKMKTEAAHVELMKSAMAIEQLKVSERGATQDVERLLQNTVEKEKRLQEAESQVDALKEHLIKLFKRNRKMEKLLEKVKLDYIELLVDEKSKIFSRLGCSSVRKNGSMDANDKPKDCIPHQHQHKVKRLGGTTIHNSMDVDGYIRDIERLKLQRKVELGELLKLKNDGCENKYDLKPSDVARSSGNICHQGSQTYPRCQNVQDKMVFLNEDVESLIEEIAMFDPSVRALLTRSEPLETRRNKNPSNSFMASKTDEVENLEQYFQPGP